MKVSKQKFTTHYAPTALELAQVILQYTVKDPGCDWIVVGDCVYIRDAQRNVVALISRKEIRDAHNKSV